MTLLKQCVRRPRRPTEQTIELAVDHPQPDAIVEIFLIEIKRSVCFEINQMLEDGIGVAGLAVRRQSHYLVLAGIHLEAGIVSERRVKQAKRVGKMNFLQHLDAVIASDADAGSGPLSDTIHCKDQRLVEGRRVKRTGRMTLMMFGEQQLVLPVEILGMRLQPFPDQVLLEQLLLEPKRQSHAKRGEPARRKGEVGLE